MADIYLIYSLVPHARPEGQYVTETENSQYIGTLLSALLPLHFLTVKKMIPFSVHTS